MAVILVPLPGFFPGTTAWGVHADQKLRGGYDLLQGAIKWSHEGCRYFLINIDIYLSENFCFIQVSPFLGPP